MEGEESEECKVNATPTAVLSSMTGLEGASMIVWAGICIDGQTGLQVIDGGSLTGLRYRDEIEMERPFAGAVGDDFILMDDNAHPHRAHVVTDYSETESILRMDWTSRSPDLNPIQHVWNVLQRNVTTRLKNCWRSCGDKIVSTDGRTDGRTDEPITIVPFDLRRGDNN